MSGEWQTAILLFWIIYVLFYEHSRYAQIIIHSQPLVWVQELDEPSGPSLVLETLGNNFRHDYIMAA